MFKRFEQSGQDRATLHMAVRLAMQGKSLSGFQFHADQKPYCYDPVKVARGTRAGGIVKSVEVSFYVPCRKCEKCLQFRRLLWRSRAINEISAAPRTWAVTLTFSPHHLAGITLEADRDFNCHDGKFKERAAYKHVQQYFYRLRKTPTAGGKARLRFRYLAVFERGEKTGRPHYHLLLHEQNGPVTKRTLEEQWRSNVHARLVAKDEQEDVRRKASYITTYATKSLDRLRASVKYGQQSPRGV